MKKFFSILTIISIILGLVAPLHAMAPQQNTSGKNRLKVLENLTKEQINHGKLMVKRAFGYAPCSPAERAEAKKWVAKRSAALVGALLITAGIGAAVYHRYKSNNDLLKNKSNDKGAEKLTIIKNAVFGGLLIDLNGNKAFEDTQHEVYVQDSYSNIQRIKKYNNFDKPFEFDSAGYENSKPFIYFKRTDGNLEIHAIADNFFDPKAEAVFLKNDNKILIQIIDTFGYVVDPSKLKILGEVGK